MSDVNETRNETDSVLEETLARETMNGRARAHALHRLGEQPPATTSLIEYKSEGRLVILGPADEAAAVGEQLVDQLEAVAIVAPQSTPTRPPMDDRLIYFHADVDTVRGHLGDFDIQLRNKGVEPVPLKAFLNKTWPRIDMVLDLNEVPVFDAQISPPGYFATRGHKERLNGFLSSIPYMVGEFEKPRYFNYDPDICVHSRNQVTACTRCIDACPTLAIVSIGEEVKVDPYLCQGGGTCAAVCPSGAMQYVYPSLGDTLGRIRHLLKDYREAGGETPRVVFMEQVNTDAVYQSLLGMPENFIPIALDELGAVDLTMLLNTLAYGSRQVIIVPGDETPGRILETLQMQLDLAHEFLQGLGYPADTVSLHDTQALARLPAVDDDERAPAGYGAFDDKRAMIRLALEHLYQHALQPSAELALSERAPFGVVNVDTQACTLCLACASVCPTRALLEGNETPQLQFVEDNCVQCGLCELTCPEDAISREHRYLFDGETRRRQRVLHEEPPFYCVQCGKPFATRKVIQHMEQRLSGHWMFGNERAVQRLKMCEDCRVKDMWDEQGA